MSVWFALANFYRQFWKANAKMGRPTPKLNQNPRPQIFRINSGVGRPIPNLMSQKFTSEKNGWENPGSWEEERNFVPGEGRNNYFQITPTNQYLSPAAHFSSQFYNIFTLYIQSGGGKSRNQIPSWIKLNLFW